MDFEWLLQKADFHLRHVPEPWHLMVLMFDVLRFEWMYVVTPAFLGTVILVLIGCVTNNLVDKRHYPQYWLLDPALQPHMIVHVCSKQLLCM